jgi:membrane fusion protein, heavy metal efflux system
MNQLRNPGPLRRGALGVLLVWLASAATAVLAADTVKLGAAQIQSLGIETAALDARQAGRIQGLPAQVVVPNKQMFVVAAPLAGLMQQVNAAAGATVAKGQSLARFQSPQLAEIQRGYLQALTQLQLAQENLQRDQQLLKEGIIAESRYRTARSQHAEAAAAFAERRQALRMAGVSDAALKRQGGLGGTIDIPAPAAGVVLEQMVVPGQRVEAATPLFKVAQLDPLWLEIQLPVAQIHDVSEGDAVAVPAANASGTVIAVGKNVGANQTVTVRAQIRAGADRLRPGQFVEATLSPAVAHVRQWSVPNAAVVRHESKVLLFVQSKEGFAAVPVSVVRESPAGTIVTGALKGDERIAVRGVAALKAALAGIGGE